ncbi:MAG TPA: DUF4864 domain-containing protein, partial [Caldimonas sp.]
MTRAHRVLAGLLFAATLVGLLSAPARAEPVSAADTQAVRAVVEAQLAAFAEDDGQRAFSYAAPSIREMFGSPERFMAMVRGSYPVVYRPSAVVFLHPAWVQGQLVQGVHLTDAGGALWLAVYNLERQPDKSWRISGC